jgi:hypothetical protein
MTYSSFCPCAWASWECAAMVSLSERRKCLPHHSRAYGTRDAFEDRQLLRLGVCKELDAGPPTGQPASGWLGMLPL